MPTPLWLRYLINPKVTDLISVALEWLTMATPHAKHHYVPKFLLKQWTGGDRKLASFKWSGERLIISRNAPKDIAKSEHLYSTERSSGLPNVTLERDYFGPRLDERAAPVHLQLLASGIEGLTGQQRTDWSRFMLAQMFRGPAAVQYMRHLGREFMLNNFRTMANHAGKPEAAEVWLQPERRDTLDDVGLQGLGWLIESPEFNRDIVYGEWAIIDIKRGQTDAVISDRPTVYLGDLNENAFVLALPLSPWKYFVSASTTGDIDKVKTAGGLAFVDSANLQAIKQAEAYVYAVDKFRHEPLVRKHLRRA